MDLNESNYLFGQQIKFHNVNPQMDHIRDNFIDNADKEKVVDWQFGDNEFNAIDRADMQGTYEQEFPAKDMIFETIALHKYSGGFVHSGYIKMIIQVKEAVVYSLMQ